MSDLQVFVEEPSDQIGVLELIAQGLSLQIHMSGRGIIGDEYFNLTDDPGLWINKDLLGKLTADNWWH